MNAKLLSLLALGAALGLGCATAPEADIATPPATQPKAEEPITKAEEKPAEDKGVDPEAAQKALMATKAPVTEGGVKAGDEVAVIETSKGRIVVGFRPDKAPKHVANFKDLVSKKFYDGTRFHRCIEGFMIQGGDPNSKNLSQASMWGTGGNVVDGREKMIDLEPSDLLHERGVLSMARSADPNSASSQFFIMHQKNTGLDGQYSAFGKVITGMDVVDKIVVTGDAADNGAVEPSKAVVVKSIRLAKWPIK